MATVKKPQFSYLGVTREMTAKLRNGDTISDGELDKMIVLLEELERILSVMPEDYGLALRDSRMQLNRLRDYKDARRRG